MDLAEFYAARLDEREQWAHLARSAEPNKQSAWRADHEKVFAISGPEMAIARSASVAPHIALNDPAAVLADIEAKRKILQSYHLDFNDDGEPICLGGAGEMYWDVLRILGAVFDSHPDYNQAWRPEP